MHPAAFVMLDRLPLTNNGKIDRRALPAPDHARPALEQAFVAPRTPREAALAEAWASALGIAQVGIHDNSFDLGGDSIRSIQVLAQAQARGLNITLQQLFQHQTIYELAQVLDQAQAPTTAARPSQPFSLISEADRARLQRLGDRTTQPEKQEVQ
jgi:aryl carrier-like protein